MYSYENVEKPILEKVINQLSNEKIIKEIEQIIGKNRELFICKSLVKNEEENLINFLVADNSGDISSWAIAEIGAKIKELINYDKIIIQNKLMFSKQLHSAFKDLTKINSYNILNIEAFFKNNFEYNQMTEDTEKLVSAKITDMKLTAKLVPRKERKVFIRAVIVDLSELAEEIEQEIESVDTEESAIKIGTFFK